MPSDESSPSQLPPTERPLLSYDKALERVLAAVPAPLPPVACPLIESLGRVVAEDIIAPNHLPPFDNSAVDGYAVSKADYQALAGGEKVLAIGEEVRAGGTPLLNPIPVGTAIPIYTGAPVPPETESIVMVEDSERTAENAVCLRDAGTPRHIRRAGSDVEKGSLAVPSGTVLDPGVIGLLAALNVTQVPCYTQPKVGIVTTGDELIPAGSYWLQPGQIRDSNRWSLTAAVVEADGITANSHHARDTPEAIRSALEACTAAKCDVIVSCGGVSVGAHDHVKAVVEEIGTLDFWRIAIKPGKPLAFGKIGEALYFGLPGNPVSSLVTFELFVRPVLRKLGGFHETTRRMVSAILDEPIEHESGRREFVRARLTWRDNTFHATTTGAQGSHRLHSLLEANAYLILCEEAGDYSAGTVVSALLLSE